MLEDAISEFYLNTTTMEYLKKPKWELGTIFFDKQERKLYTYKQKIMENGLLKIIMVSVIHLINYFLKPLINSATIPGHFGPG
jgi:hypothetical protein